MNVVIYFKNGNKAYFKDVEDYNSDALNIFFYIFWGFIARKKISSFL